MESTTRDDQTQPRIGESSTSAETGLGGDERQRATEVLGGEYALLGALLSTT